MTSAASKTLRSPTDLADAALVSDRERRALEAVAARYAVAITPAVAALMDPDDPDDPIAAQFLPDPRELAIAPEERLDPIDDAAHSPVKGVVHRYPDRVLLKAVHACPVYCRFCFRREMVGPGGETTLKPAELEAALDYIAARPDIWEVILTGGDPFILSPARIRDLTDRLAAIDHVKIIRWHTRVPVADPDRVAPALVEALRAEGASTWVALHVNHARELSPPALSAIARLVDAGTPVVSQTVLLKGVNDDAETLEALMRALVEARVKPYYLHHLDLAPGTGRFRVSLDDGRAIAGTLRSRASGLCQPTYVLDVPGGASKAPICEAEVRRDETGAWRAKTADGRWAAYPPAPDKT